MNQLNGLTPPSKATQRRLRGVVRHSDAQHWQHDDSCEDFKNATTLLMSFHERPEAGATARTEADIADTGRTLQTIK
jgi:hypothetical protein